MKYLFLLTSLLTLPVFGQVSDHPPTESSVQNAYSTAIQKLELKRLAFQAQYEGAPQDKRDSILIEARKEVFRALREDIFPEWYGTEWAFSGTTETPGEGKIACGYFVSTTLRDAGFELNRYKIAQQASQKIIEVFSQKSETRINAGQPVSEVITHLTQSGPGLYIVGLDTHVGFVTNHDGDLRFIHSSYYNPPLCVVSEPIDGVNPLADSNYRVIGKILGDDMMKGWIRGDSFRLQ